jgi:hypothetical protein
MWVLVLTFTSPLPLALQFESLATRPADTTSTSTEDQQQAGMVDSTSEFATLVRFKLGHHIILMAAEIDCIDPAAIDPGLEGQEAGQLPQLQGYVELKTCK